MKGVLAIVLLTLILTKSGINFNLPGFLSAEPSQDEIKEVIAFKQDNTKLVLKGNANKRVADYWMRHQQKAIFCSDWSLTPAMFYPGSAGISNNGWAFQDHSCLPCLSATNKLIH